MIRKLLIAGVAAVALSACSSSSDLAANITAVQKATVAACAYLPTATTIAKIFEAKAAGLSQVTTIAAAICDAVKPVATALVATTPTVAGVVIEGDFVVVKKP